MAKTIFTGAHAVFVEVLVEARKRAGLTQSDLAARIGRDQSFISLIERCQRRVDTVEFYALARAMDLDPTELFASVAKRLPHKVSI